MVGKRKFQKKSRKMRRRRSKIPSEKASLRVNRSYSLMTTNQVYSIYNTQLSSNTRAAEVARAYQFYRIKKVHVKFSPLQDTFAGTGTTIPYLYYMIDRTKNLRTINTISGLKKIGAKPRRLDDKSINFSFTPSVLLATYDSQPPPGQSTLQAVQYKMSPWLTTRDQETNLWNADSTDHLGLVYAVENSGGSDVQYKVEIVLEFEFKEPSIDIVIDENLPPQVDIETLEMD